FCFLALGDDRADARLRIEAWDARPAGSKPFGQRALGRELQLKLACHELPLELGVLTDIGTDHPLDLPRLEQETQPPIINAGVIRDGRDIANPRIAKRDDELF